MFFPILFIPIFAAMESFEYIQSCAILSPYVKNYWTLEAGNPGGVSERIIPTGFQQLVFHRAGRMFSSADNDYQPQSFICGQFTGYTDLSSSGNVHMIVVTFHPFGAKMFFSTPMQELYRQNVSLQDMDDKLLKELENKVYDSRDNSEAIRHIEKYLIARLTRTDSYNLPRITEVINTISHRHEYNISALSAIACLSYKQFGRIFADYVGTTPKEFTRIVRFQRALHILSHKPAISPVELAVECGYYDQPHLIKEFKLFSGYTPNEYTTVCQPYSDYFAGM